MSEESANGLREIMRRYPTGVTIVTSLLDGKPWGGTMNSFTSISLSPPLVALFVMDKSRTTSAILQTQKYAINILKLDQETPARAFASDGAEDKFKGISYSTSPDGIPLLTDSLGYLECKLISSSKIADHYLFVGEVEKASVLNDAEALIFYRRAFRNFNGTS